MSFWPSSEGIFLRNRQCGIEGFENYPRRLWNAFRFYRPQTYAVYSHTSVDN